MEDVIEICKLFDVPDDELWEPLLADAKRDNSKMPQLMYHVDSLRKPQRLMTYLSNETTLGDMRGSILGMFDKIEILDKMLKKATK